MPTNIEEIIKCSKCPETLPRKRLDYHRRTKHQTQTTITWPDKTKELIHRDPVTQLFACPKCCTSNADPSNIQSHTQSCFAYVPTTADLHPIDPDDNLPLPRRPSITTTQILPTFPIRSRSTIASALPASHMSSAPTFSRHASLDSSSGGRLSRLRRRLSFNNLLSSTPKPPSNEVIDLTEQDETSLESIPLLSSSNTEYTPEQQEKLPPVYVCPDEHTVLHHADVDLRKFALVVNTKYKTLICLTCQQSTTVKDIRAHLKAHFPLMPIPEDLHVKITSHFELVDHRDIPFPSGPIAPIFGLRLERITEDNELYFCSRCHHGYRDLHALKSHQRSQDRCPGGVGTYTRGHSQTFTTGPHRAYFQVLPSLVLPPPPDTSLFDLYIKDKPVLPAPEDTPITVPVNFQDLSQFLQRDHWLLHIEGHKPRDLHNLISLSDEDPVLGSLRERVNKYLTNIQELLPSYSSFGILRKMAQTLADSTSTHSLRVVLPSTIQDKYGSHLSRLLLAVIRTAKGLSTSSYRLRMSPDIKSLAVELFDTLATNEPEDVVQRSIHELVYALCIQRKVDWQEDKFFSPIISYTVLASITEQGNWRMASVITQIMAALEFCIRSCLIFQMHLDTARYKISINNAYDKYADFLTDNHETPMAFLFNAHSYLKTIARSEESQARADWTDPSGRELSFDGDLIKLADFEKMVDALIASHREIVEKEILFGYGHQEGLGIDFNLQTIHDDIRNYNSGYCFLDDERNTFHKFKDAYIKFILTTPELATRFTYVDTQKLMWKMGEVRQLQNSFEKVRRIEMQLVYLSAGPVPRGSELSVDLLRNPGLQKIRSTLILYHVYTVCSQYTKNSWRGNRNRLTPHAPTNAVAKMRIYSDAIFRPAEVFFVQLLKGDIEAKRFSEYLWPGFRQNISSEEFSTMLGDTTREHLQVSLKIRAYRQVFTAIAHRHRDYQLYEMSKQYIDDLDSNHGTETANAKYGLDFQSLANHDARFIVGSLNVALNWQRLLNLGQEEPLIIGLGGQNVVQGRLIPGHANQDGPDPDPSFDTQSTVPEWMKDVNTWSHTFASISSDKVRSYISAALSECYREHHPPPPPPEGRNWLPQGPEVVPHPSRLRVWREFRKDLNAHFNSPEQAELVEMMNVKTKHVVAVLPCGSGKTETILFQAKAYDFDKITLCLLPLISLQEDYKRRCRGYGISFARWSVKNQNPFGTIVVASVENTLIEEFKRYVTHLVNIRRLARIVFDEAQMIASERTYRLAFSHLKPFFENLGVQAIFLSGTLPPSIIPPLMADIGIERYHLIRSTTHRPEIKYSVRLVKPEEDMDALIVDLLKRIRPDLEKNNERCFIYCRTKVELKKLAKLTGLDVFYGGMENPEKALERFVEGHTLGLVCTTALTAGANILSARWCIIRGPSYSLLDLLQQSSRVARDGKPSFAVTFYDPKLFNPSTEESEFDLGTNLLIPWLLSKECRRIMPWQFVDGVARNCVIIPKAVLCDNCEIQYNQSPPDHAVYFPANPHHTMLAKDNTVEKDDDSKTAQISQDKDEESDSNASDDVFHSFSSAPTPFGNQPDAYRRARKHETKVSSSVGVDDRSLSSARKKRHRSPDSSDHDRHSKDGRSETKRSRHSRSHSSYRGRSRSLDSAPSPPPPSEESDVFRSVKRSRTDPHQGNKPSSVRFSSPPAAKRMKPSTPASPTPSGSTVNPKFKDYISLGMSLLKKGCPVCWARGYKWQDHTLGKCQAGIATQSDYNYTRWRSSIRLPSGTCFACCIPQQSGGGWHIYQQTHELKLCPDRDIIKPAIYALLQSDHKTQVQHILPKDINIKDSGMVDRWLVAIPTKRANGYPCTNIIELFVWLIAERRLIKGKAPRPY